MCEAERPVEHRARRPEPKHRRPTAARAARLRSLATTTAIALLAGGLLGMGFRAAFPEPRARWSQALSTRAGSVAGAWSKAVKWGSVPPAAAATTSSSTHCPDEMAMVDGGRYVMGADDGEASPERTSVARGEPLSVLYRSQRGHGLRLQALRRRGQIECAPFEVDWKGISRQQKKVFSPACNGDDPERSVHPVNCVDWSMAGVLRARRRAPAHRGRVGARRPRGRRPHLPVGRRASQRARQRVRKRVRAWGRRTASRSRRSTRGRRLRDDRAGRLLSPRPLTLRDGGHGRQRLGVGERLGCSLHT